MEDSLSKFKKLVFHSKQEVIYICHGLYILSFVLNDHALWNCDRGCRTECTKSALSEALKIKHSSYLYACVKNADMRYET